MSAVGVSADEAQRPLLRQDFVRIAHGFKGKVGVCATDAHGTRCLNGDHPFSLQSVMKLIVAMAVMDGVDKGIWRLDDKVHIERKDLSVGWEPVAALAGDKGYDTTLGDLLHRAVTESDNAAADILVRRLGGPRKAQAFLKGHGIRGIRVDRDERHLQSEIAGLRWRQDYSDPAVFAKAQADVPAEQRTAAYRYYQADIRDTATPRAMAKLLWKLAQGKLLSADSTAYLLKVMAETKTGPDRLKAGLPSGWSLAHKTGTSGSWQGIAAATNDVGILTAPDGGKLAVAVFIGDSHAPDDARAATIAGIGAAVATRYRP